MARQYSRKKGKSSSNKPAQRTKPGWISYDAKTVEQLVVKLAKTGKTSAEIGLALRDTYGIPDVRAITSKRITKILEENNLGSKIPECLKSLIRRDVAIIKHLELHKHDVPAGRGLILTESKIGRMIKYYKRVGKLPRDWAFDRSKAKTLIE